MAILKILKVALLTSILSQKPTHTSETTLRDPPKFPEGEPEKCLRRCIEERTCQYMGFSPEGSCFTFSIAPVTISEFLKYQTKPTAVLVFTSLEYGEMRDASMLLHNGILRNNGIWLPKRGMGVATLDGNLVRMNNYKYFNTNHPVGGLFLRQYVEGLNFGQIMIGASIDDVKQGLTEHLSYLKSQGLDFSPLGYRSKVAFVFQKGYPEKTIMEMEDSSYVIGEVHPLVVNVSIYRPYPGVDIGFFYFKKDFSSKITKPPI